MEGNIIDAAKNLLGGDFQTDVIYWKYTARSYPYTVTISGSFCILLLEGADGSASITVRKPTKYYTIRLEVNMRTGSLEWSYLDAGSGDRAFSVHGEIVLILFYMSRE